MATQWRIGMSGPAGLDYNVLPYVMRRTGVVPAERDAVFEAVRILEDAALETMHAEKQ